MTSKAKPPAKGFYDKVDKDELDKWSHAAVADHKFNKGPLAGLKKAQPKLKEKK